MSLRASILKGSSILAAGQVVTFGCSFVRNIILARVLSKTDFGIALTFAITMTLFELAGKMAISRLMIQSKDGDSVEFQATAHLFQALAGLLSAFLIYILAGPIAIIFKVPEARMAFQFLALIPLFKGLEHLDVSRVERKMQFGPIVCIDVIPQVLITLAAWPLVNWLESYWVLLWLLLAKRGLTMIGSHLFAHRRYRWSLNTAYVKQILTFGWPLLINGFLMFAIFQGDRFVVGSYYDVAALAVYGVAASLSLVPGLMMVKVIGSIMLPLMSRAQDAPAEFKRHYALCSQMLALLSAVFATSLIICGESFVTLVYGPKYAGVNVGIILGWLVTANALRLLRVTPTIAAMAKGDTENMLISNVFRVIGLGVAIVAAGKGMELYYIAMSALVGETLAFFVSVLRLAKRHDLNYGDSFGPALLTTILVCMAGGFAKLGSQTASWPVIISLMVGMAVLALVATLVLFSNFRGRFMTEIKTMSMKMKVQ
jgi:O-antigen/teichoic acid export membrane protein